MLKSNPIPARWATHKWENNSTKCSCIDMKVLGITSVFPTWGSSKGTGNPQGMTLKIFQRTGETETFGGHKQNLVHIRTQGKRSSYLKGD